MSYGRYIALFFILNFVWNGIVFATDDSENLKLANQYFEQGDYSKAIDIYRTLENNKDLFFDIYPQYLESIIQIHDLKAGENLIQTAYQLSNKNPVYLFELAVIYKEFKEEKSAQKQFDKALQSLKGSVYQIQSTAKYLLSKKQMEWAKSVYIRGEEVLKDPAAFDLELAYIDGLQGNDELMIQSFIQYAYTHPENLQEVIRLIEPQIEDKGKADLLEENLLRAIGKDKQAWSLIELLAWLYQKQEDYASAFDQIRSLDLLRQEDGAEVLQLARIANREKDYRTASRAYKYLIDKGRNSPYFATSTLENINNQKSILLQNPDYTYEDIDQLKNSYQQLIQENFSIYFNVMAKLDLANLFAKYIHQLDSSIAILLPVVEDRLTPKDLQAMAKLDLGDYYIMNDQSWESTLLYTQVAKDDKGTPIAEEAKYRNARLSFFKGDFDWALTQLKVIKANTFELISNDAIELASFISDNYHQDYEVDKTAMKLYAQMQLLLFQNKLKEANQIADTMLVEYKDHPIADNVLYSKAMISEKLRDFNTEEIYLQKLVNQFPKSVLADKAAYLLAQLYEFQWKKPEKAKTYYEKILMDYPDSIYTIDARKRYRILRGDSL